jgi:ABC-type transporter Mla subunit MlaD
VALRIHDERLTRRVGAVVLVLAVMTVIFVVVVLDRLQPDGVHVRIRFAEVVGLPPGAAVKLLGEDIGVVRRIAIATAADGVVVDVVLEPAWAKRIPINADFFVDARSALAPRYVAIGPPREGAPPGRKLVEGDEVIGVSPPNLDRILQRTWDNLEEVSRFLEALRPATARMDASAARLSGTLDTLDPRPGASAELRARAGDVIGSAQALVDDLRAGGFDPAAVARLGVQIDGFAARIETTVAALRGDIARVRTAVVGLAAVGPDLSARLGVALLAADRTLGQAEELAAAVRGVIADATAGSGAIAAFAADFETIDDIKELTKELKREPWRLIDDSH